jgi:hypothetical protein
MDFARLETAAKSSETITFSLLLYTLNRSEACSKRKTVCNCVFYCILLNCGREKYPQGRNNVGK